MQNILFWKDEMSDKSAEELKTDNIPHLTPFVQKEAGEPYPCMIVLPGGGYELHVFPEGRHGLGLCSIGDRRNAYIARWRELCAQWLERQGF